MAPLVRPAIALGALLVACGPTERVVYRPGGMTGDSVVFVEERDTREGRRQYLVLCHPARVPPCVRVAPETKRSETDIEEWLASDTTPRRGPRPVPNEASVRAGPIASVPLADDAAWDDDAAGAPAAAEPPADLGNGIVNIVTPGGWANVYDERGRFLGQTPMQLRLPTGRYSLTLRPFGQPPGDPTPIVVDVRPAETVSIVRRLDGVDATEAAPAAASVD